MNAKLLSMLVLLVPVIACSELNRGIVNPGDISAASVATTAVQRAGDTMTGNLTNQQSLLLGTNIGTRTTFTDQAGFITGYNSGTQTVGAASGPIKFGYGAHILGWNKEGIQTVTRAGGGIYGYNAWVEQLISAEGGEIRGFVSGSSGTSAATQTVSGVGSSIRGLNNQDIQTVSGKGSMLLINDGSATISGNESIGLGAVTITHDRAIVLGDGQTSSANESVKAAGGFYGPGTGLTDIDETSLDASVNASLDLADSAVQLTYSTPATNSAAGTAGTFSYDLNYLYVCVSNATWRRVALPSW